jgi:hypothetical protein
MLTPDVWESSAFSGIFLASGFFYISNIVHARPHANNTKKNYVPILNPLWTGKL